MTETVAQNGDSLTTGLDRRPTVDRPYQTILLDRDVDEAIATITLNRPKSYNAVSFQMMDEIVDALEDLRLDNEIKVVILQANGKHFTSGHDMKELKMLHKPGQRQGLAERINRDRRRAGEGWEAILRFNKPLVLKLHGKAIGAGGQFVIAADIVVAADDSEITMSPQRFGGPVQDATLPLWILTVGLKRMKLSHYTGIGINGKVAAEMGLVTKSVPKERLDETTMKIAKAVAMLPLDGLVLSKEWINMQLGMMGVMPGLLPGYLGHAFYSNIKYRESEYNFLKTVQDKGMAEAYRIRDERFEDLLGDWFDE